MKLDRFIRIAIAVGLFAVFVIALGALLFVTESALNIWDRLREAPAVILYGYLAILLLLFAAVVILVLRLVVRRNAKPEARSETHSRQSIERRLSDAAAAGVDVSDAQQELGVLAASSESGTINLCFFGEISSGKSSLIRALVPEADVVIDVVGGSTDEVRRYRWRGDSDQEILLTDVPGTGGHDGQLDTIAADEARRAHLVLFVCDGDLTRAELRHVQSLLAFDKPLIVVLNKADRYNTAELAEVMQRLLERIDNLGAETSRDQVVAVTAGGSSDVVQRDEDGKETIRQQERDADIGVLVVAINRLLNEHSAMLDVRRERAVFRLAAEKLEQAESLYRDQRAEQIIRNSTRKAVVGALAAVSPGTDVLIQGYIGTAMTQELCALYGAAPRDLDVEDFLNLTQSRVGRALPLSLAVSGNGLKAFPGLGTVAGGLVHAVAYGLIFDALGRSLVHTLKRHGKLDPEAAAQEFEDGISEHLEAGVRRVTKMALDQKSD